MIRTIALGLRMSDVIIGYRLQSQAFSQSEFGGTSDDVIGLKVIWGRLIW